MAIDGSINDNSGLIKKSDIETSNNPFYISNVIVAGTFRVKHLLIDQPMIIWGFVIYDRAFNQEDFKIHANEIKYKTENQRYECATNKVIYPKMAIDNQQHHFSRFMKDDNEIELRDSYSTTIVKKMEGIYKKKNYEDEYEDEYEYLKEFKYYLFSDVFSDIPTSATNESIWAICKFREDGIFKHAIFNFHELIQIENS